MDSNWQFDLIPSDFDELFKKLEDAKPVAFQQYLLNESLHEAQRFKRKSLMSQLEEKFVNLMNNVCSKSAPTTSNSSSGSDSSSSSSSSSNNHSNSVSSRNHSTLTPPPEA